METNVLNIEDFDKIKEASKQKSARISAWQSYYEKQKIITVISNNEKDRELFKNLSEKVGTNENKIAFIVLFPVSFFHLNDFKSKIENATAKFYFLKNGTVIGDEKIALKIINFGRAYKEIAQRVTGVYVSNIIPEVNEKDLLSEEDEQKLTEKLAKFDETLNLWMEKFRKLPAVNSVTLYDMESTDRLVTIEIKINFPDKESADWYCLNIGGKIDHPNWDYAGEPSTLYEEWSKGSKVSTWKELYDSLVELSNLYVNVPQPQ
ncbi:MAG: hypothetical protein NT068_01660 [Candidatus Nomurabacteria bacterium]|nr:hypothetical protein [Candidatus Nomurabacteria bacterium]